MVPGFTFQFCACVRPHQAFVLAVVSCGVPLPYPGVAQEAAVQHPVQDLSKTDNP
jgi:hypothetical protein